MADQILIAYYSWAGSTARLARQIHDKTGGELFEIIPQVPYPGDYDACTVQAKKEIQAGYKPELKTSIAGLEKFGVILLGSPNWWSSLAPPAARFLSESDLGGKIIAPFCTHGGGGQGHIVKDIEKLCPRSKVLTCLAVGGRSGLVDEHLQAWLKQAGVA
ncbi:MAG: flavodoxin [Treponema sp.]|jgi:flavodoxin|nr:flavodoxin [Treponema sp.]